MDRRAACSEPRCAMSVILSLLVVAVVFAIVLSLVLTRFLYICQPNEVLVFSGGQRASVGRKVGYRIIKGGRALRIPLLETVDSMDLTNMPIEVAVQGAYSKGGIPVNVHGIANVKIAGGSPCSTTRSSVFWASIGRASWRSPRTHWRATCAACWRR